MSNPKNPLAWAAKAEEDYAMAGSSLQRRTPFTAISCFHSQQCAEKYLKAILVARKYDFPKIHDLLKLLNLCEKANVLVPISEDALDRTTKFAVIARYPGTEPTLEEAREALETAKAVRKFARKYLGI